MKTTATRLIVFGALVTAVLVFSPMAYGQNPCACEPDKHFTAQRVEHLEMEFSDGTVHVSEIGGLLARDASGRVYGETHPLRSTSSEFPNPIQSARDVDQSGFGKKDRIYSTVSIYDCLDGKSITIFPDLKLARVAENGGSTSSRKRNPSNVSFFEALALMPRPYNALFADLGFKDIGEIRTHGLRVTVLGTEQDGEWNGRPTYITEYWVFDDLSVTILEIRTNLKGKNKNTITVSDIRRNEPNPSLFEIPPDYTINHAPQEMHFPESNPKPHLQQ
jgi:hypothetical protein